MRDWFTCLACRNRSLGNDQTLACAVKGCGECSVQNVDEAVGAKGSKAEEASEAAQERQEKAEEMKRAVGVGAGRSRSSILRADGGDIAIAAYVGSSSPDCSRTM